MADFRTIGPRKLVNMDRVASIQGSKVKELPAYDLLLYSEKGRVLASTRCFTEAELASEIIRLTSTRGSTHE